MEKENLKEVEKDLGVQPLDALMVELGVQNTDLVRMSPSQLSHKNVGKGRKGKRLTRNIQRKILEALTLWCREEQVGPENLNLEMLFTYRGN